MDWYGWGLALHSWLRWLVLLGGVVAVSLAITGWMGRRSWSRAADRAGLLFTASLDAQLVVGFVLYFLLSPVTGVALENVGAAMANAVVRFWAVEHLALMLVAVALAHGGRRAARKAASDLARQRRTAVLFGLALLLVIPWPGMLAGRPLFRF